MEIWRYGDIGDMEILEIWRYGDIEIWRYWRSQDYMTTCKHQLLTPT
jgi:hypothetical protein